MKKLKDIFKLLFCLSAVAPLFSLAGCEKKFELDFPLTVSQRNLELTANGGDNHILVYSTGDWTVGFDREIDWGSLDRRTGTGNSEFVFSFDANYGISRKVTIRIVSGNLRDSIVCAQKGAMSSATVSFADAAVTVADTAATVSVGFSTNLLFAACDFNARVAYYDGDGGRWIGELWLSNIIVSGDSVSFNVKENRQDRYRKADITVYIEDADGEEYNATISVTQVPVGMTS